MKSLLALFCCVIASTLFLVPDAAGQGTREQIQKMHQDPKAYIAMLESPERTAESRRLGSWRSVAGMPT